MSDFELDLAQSRTEEYVTGLEKGIAAAEQHELITPGVLSYDDDTQVIYDGLLKTVATVACDAEQPLYDTEGACAFGLGVLEGVLSTLKNKSEVIV